MTRHWYGISADVPQTSTSGGVVKCVGGFLRLKSAGIQWIESKSDASDSELRRFLRFGFKSKKKRSFVFSLIAFFSCLTSTGMSFSSVTEIYSRYVV